MYSPFIFRRRATISPQPLPSSNPSWTSPPLVTRTDILDLTRRSRAIITRHLKSRHDDAMPRLLPPGAPAWLRHGRPPSVTSFIAGCATSPEQSHVATRVAVVATWRVAWDGTFGIQAFRPDASRGLVASHLGTFAKHQSGGVEDRRSVPERRVREGLNAWRGTRCREGLIVCRQAHRTVATERRPGDPA